MSTMMFLAWFYLAWCWLSSHGWHFFKFRIQKLFFTIDFLGARFLNFEKRSTRPRISNLQRKHQNMRQCLFGDFHHTEHSNIAIVRCTWQAVPVLSIVYNSINLYVYRLAHASRRKRLKKGEMMHSLFKPTAAEIASSSSSSLLRQSQQKHHRFFAPSLLSFSSSSASSSSGTNDTTTAKPATTTDAAAAASSSSSCCDIIAGPSLLRTSNVNRPRPSLLHLHGLRSLPFWTSYNEATHENRIAYQEPSLMRTVKHLQHHFTTILQEYSNVSPTSATSDYVTTSKGENEHDDAKLHQGTWDWHSYMTKGKVLHDDNNNHAFSQRFPKTTAILQTLREEQLLFEGTPFGYCFFSTLHANSRIQAHSSPLNFRLRIHLPLIVPSPPPSTSTPSSEEKQDDDDNDNDSQRPLLLCGIRVGTTTRCWIPGQALVLDDAYNHQVWNNNHSSSTDNNNTIDNNNNDNNNNNNNNKRVLLLVDVWHPDVTLQERREIVEMFQHAQQQGWIN
jgi:Aspartyl/Asparaginyl beta-hydroxylase